MDIGQLISVLIGWIKSNTPLALLSAASGAAITSGINIFLKHLEYRQAFYKEIIQRRLKAFDELNELIQPFWKSRQVSGHQAFNTMFYSPEDSEPLIQALIDSGMKNSVWLTDEARDAIRSLTEFLETLEENDLALDSDPEQIRSVANEMQEHLLLTQLELERNFDSIYNVKAFQRNRQKWLDSFKNFE